MRNTGYGTIPNDAVKGYVRVVTAEFPKGVWRNGRQWNQAAAGGFGGIYSTLEDMLRWSRALENDKILSAASRNAMFTDYGHNYGFGWQFAPKYGRNLIWHTGNDPRAGFACIFDRFPEEDLTVVAMTNNTGLTDSKATLIVGGQPLTFQANAARKLVEQVEGLYFGRAS